MQQLESNKPECTKLLLESNQLNALSQEEKENFCKNIANNTHLTILDIKHNTIGVELAPQFIDALKKNTAIHRIYYDKKWFSEEDRTTIQSLTERNQQFTLNREINPMLLQLRGYIDFAIALKAAEIGKLDFLHTVLTDNPDWINKTTSGDSLLCTAAKHGAIDCVKLNTKRSKYQFKSDRLCGDHKGYGFTLCY
jgi:hypothetical protein